jgi:hypothetical protein
MAPQIEVSGQLHVSAASTPGNSRKCPLGMKLSGPQSQSGHGGEE